MKQVFQRSFQSLCALVVGSASLLAAQEALPGASPASPAPGGGTSASSTPGVVNARSLSCVKSLRDQSGGDCVEADSVATQGKLFPYPGKDNSFTAPAVVAGGELNIATGTHAFIGGGRSNRSAGAYSSVGGGFENSASGSYTTVCGGRSSSATGHHGTVSGGVGHTADGTYSVIGGGDHNRTEGTLTTIGGGIRNQAVGATSTIGGGAQNETWGAYATIGGGRFNVADADHATISGGAGNFAQGSYSTISGGRDNRTSGAFSFAGGRRAEADHDGAFVWGDSTNVTKTSSAADEFNVYAEGGARFFAVGTTSPSLALTASGETVQPVASGGLVKASCHVNGVSETISRSFNNLPGGSTITMTRLATGEYEVDFGVDITARHYIATLGRSDFGAANRGGISVQPRVGNPNAVYVQTWNVAGALENNFFFLSMQ